MRGEDRMGKVRLECPHCGKAIRVSDTAKKAKCPGCKEIIDVAALVAALRLAQDGDTEPVEGVAGAGGEEAEGSPSVGREGEKAAPSEPAGEKGAAVAPPPKKPSKRSNRRMKAAAKAPPKEAPKAATKIAGIQSWMIVAALSVVIFVVLFFYLQWWAALMIASAVGVYVDASLSRITRVGPSSPGWSVGPMIWGLIAFALGVGPLIYILLRRKLLANSPEDIAGADMTQEDLEETGKVRAPSLASPGVLLVVALALGLGVMFQKKPSLQIRLGEKFWQKSRRIDGSNPRDIYDSKKPFHVAITANKAFDEEDYKTLTWIVFPRGDDEESPVTQGEVTWDEKVARPGGKKRLWHWTVQVDEPGPYVLKVMHGEDKTFMIKEFRLRSVN